MNSNDMEWIASRIRSRIAASPDLQKWVNDRLGGVPDEHGTSQRSKVSVCDFCNKAISNSAMHVVNGPVVEKATAGGYLPKNLPAHYQGLDHERQLTAWRMCVKSYSGAEWGICGPCNADLLAHSTKTSANAFDRPHPRTAKDSVSAKTSGPATQASTKASGVAADTDKARSMAVMRVLVAVARVDGVIDEREKVLLREFVSKLGVTRDEFQRLATEKAHVNIAHLPVDHAERLALLVDVFSLALADSALAGEEKVLAERLAKSLEVGPGELDGCLRTARDRIAGRSAASASSTAEKATFEPTNDRAEHGGERWVFFLVRGPMAASPGSREWAEFETTLMQFLRPRWDEDDLRDFRFRAFPVPQNWERESDHCIVLRTVEANLPQGFREDADWVWGKATLSASFGLEYPFILVRTALLPPVRLDFARWERLHPSR